MAEPQPLSDEGELFFNPAFFDEETHVAIEKLLAEQKAEVTPFRTEPDDPDRKFEGNSVPFYVPLVNKEGEHVEKNEKLDFLPGPSPVAHKRLNIIMNVLTVPASNIALFFKKQITQEQSEKYTHKFNLLTDNCFELFELLAGFKRGDVWFCAIGGDILYHTPRPAQNIYNNPAYRERCAKLEAQVRIEMFKQVKNKEQSLRIRVKQLESQVEQLYKLGDQCYKVQQALQMLLSLHQREKYSAETVSYLRDNIGKHAREIQELRDFMFPKKEES